MAKREGDEGLTLISFMRFDEIVHSSQSNNLFFVAHIEEMAIMKSLLHVKYNGQGAYLRQKFLPLGYLSAT